MTAPTLKLHEAERVGERLHDTWRTLTGAEPPYPRESTFWADTVQFILREARGVVEGRDG